MALVFSAITANSLGVVITTAMAGNSA